MSGNLLFKAIQTASELLQDHALQPASSGEGEGRALGSSYASTRRLNMGKLGRRVGGGRLGRERGPEVAQGRVQQGRRAVRRAP